MLAAFRHILRTGINRKQRVIDPGFDVTGFHVIGGSGAGTSAVSGGVLAIASTDATYYIRPLMATEPCERGTYRVTFTISSYTQGSISPAWRNIPDLTAPSVGTVRGAAGTFTEDIVLTSPQYIGLKGRGSAIANTMQISNLTIARIA